MATADDIIRMKQLNLERVGVLRQMRLDTGQIGTGVVLGPLRGYGMVPPMEMLNRGERVGAFEGARKAERALDDLDREIEKVRKAREELERRVKGVRTGAGATARGGTLADRLRKRGFGISSEGVQFGPFKIGGAGFQVEGGYLAAASGKALLASIGGRVIGGLLETGVTVRDRVRQEGFSIEDAVGKALREEGVDAARSFLDFFGGIKIATAGRAILTGNNLEDEQRRTNEFFEHLSTTSAERRRRQAKIDEAVAASRAEINKLVDEQLASLDNVRPETFRLRDDAALRAYQRDKREANKVLFKIKRTVLSDEAEAQTRASLAGGY